MRFAVAGAVEGKQLIDGVGRRVLGFALRCCRCHHGWGTFGTKNGLLLRCIMACVVREACSVILNALARHENNGHGGHDSRERPVLLREASFVKERQGLREQVGCKSGYSGAELAADETRC